MFVPEAEMRLLSELRMVRLIAATDAEVAEDVPTPENVAFAAESRRLVVFVHSLWCLLTESEPPD